MADQEAGLLSKEPAVASYGTAPTAAPNPAARTSYRADIDGLRCVAVIAVIIFHINAPSLPGGFLGVDIFYVISGFVVTGSLLGAPQRSSCDYFAHFYARRLKRLTPALCLFVAITAVLLPLFMGMVTEDVTMQEYYLSAQLSTFGGANIFYATLPETYWTKTAGTRDQNPWLHCWSLGVEEQFYFVFPAFVLVLYYATVVGETSERESTSKVSALNVRGCSLSVMTIFAMLSWAASATGSVLALSSNAWANYVFFLSPFRFWQLACGAILFMWMHGDQLGSSTLLSSSWVAPLMAWTTVAAYALGFTFDSGQSNAVVQLCWAVATTIATCFFIVAGAPIPPHGSRVSPPLLHTFCCLAPVRYIGKVSYQLYLWHWPTILFARRLATVLETQPVATRVTLIASFALCSGVGLPLFSYHIMEWPIRSRWHPNPMVAIISMLALIGGTCGWVQVLRGPLGESLSQGSVHLVALSHPTSMLSNALSAAPFPPPALPDPPSPPVGTPLMPPSPLTPPLPSPLNVEAACPEGANEA